MLAGLRLSGEPDGIYREGLGTDCKIYASLLSSSGLQAMVREAFLTDVM